MALGRYKNETKYKQFCHYAYRGDIILEDTVNKILEEQTDLTKKQRNLLKPTLLSNKLLSQFEVPFKYKKNMPKLRNPNKNYGIKGDIVETYILWVKTNYGEAAVKRYVENQIIKVTCSNH